MLRGFAKFPGHLPSTFIIEKPVRVRNVRIIDEDQTSSWRPCPDVHVRLLLTPGLFCRARFVEDVPREPTVIRTISLDLLTIVGFM
jgi:hypothetical protein